MKDNKTEKLITRVTEDEKREVIEKANSLNMSMSDYIRFVSLNAKVEINV